MLETFSTAAKAWVTATVSGIAAYAASKYGFLVPGEVQSWVAGVIWAAVSGYITFLVPNKEA